MASAVGWRIGNRKPQSGERKFSSDRVLSPLTGGQCVETFRKSRCRCRSEHGSVSSLALLVTAAYENKAHGIISRGAKASSLMFRGTTFVVCVGTTTNAFPKQSKRFGSLNRANDFLLLLRGSLCADVHCAFGNLVRPAPQKSSLIWLTGLSVGTAFQAPKIVDVGITQVENRSLRILLQHVALLMSLGHHFPPQTLQSSVVHESLTLARPVFARPSTSVQTISQYGQLLTSSLLRNSSNIGRRNWNCAPLSRTRASTF